MKARSFFEVVRRLQINALARLISVIILYTAVKESEEPKTAGRKVVKKLKSIILATSTNILVKMLVWEIGQLEKIRTIKQSETWRKMLQMVGIINGMYLKYQFRCKWCKQNLESHAGRFVEKNFSFSVSVFASCSIIMTLLQITGRVQQEPIYSTIGISMIASFFVLGILTIAQGLIFSFVRASPEQKSKEKEETTNWDFSKRLNMRAYNIVKEYMKASTVFVIAIVVFAIMYIFTRNINVLRMMKFLSIVIPTMYGIPMMISSIIGGIKPTEDEEIKKEIMGLNSVKTSGGG